MGVFTNPRTGQPYKSEDYAAYSLLWTAVAPTTVGVQASKQINSDSDFMVQKLTYWASSNLSQVNNPVLQLMLTDGGAQKNLFDAPLFFEELAGTGQLPFVLPINRMFSANSVIQGTLYNLTTATTYDYVQLQLHGVRCYW